MLTHNFCRNNGRLVKLFLFSTLLHKSSLTAMYFATSEKKGTSGLPYPHNQSFWFSVSMYVYLQKTKKFGSVCGET